MKNVMVAMWMREQNRVDMMDALTNQERHDDFLADRFRCGRTVAGLVSLESSAGVDHDRMPARRLNQDRISLSNVDEGNPQVIPGRPRRQKYERTRGERNAKRRNPESHKPLSRQVLARERRSPEQKSPRMRILSVLLLAVVSFGMVPAQAASLITPTLHDGRSDFNFLLGHWHTQYRLRKPLVHDTVWRSCTGAAVVTPFWDKEANLEVGTLNCPSRHTDSMTLRAYSRSTHQWSLWWGTKKLGVSPPQQVGHFNASGVGQFFANDTWNGKPIIVRYQWSMKKGLPHFEQAFSVDGGATWETNWICDYTRA